jgi:hypothetical protein
MRSPVVAGCFVGALTCAAALPTVIAQSRGSESAPAAGSHTAPGRLDLFSGEASLHVRSSLADGLVFVLAGANDLVALDVAAGTQVWSRPNLGAVGTRGLNYWRGVDGRDRRLLYIAGGLLTAVDARTGQTVETHGGGPPRARHRTAFPTSSIVARPPAIPRSLTS